MNASDIAHGLMSRPVKNRSGWLVLCPLHGDKKPSLSINNGDDGRILLKCFAGCGFLELRAELESRGLWDGESSPAPKAQPPIDRSDLLDRLWNESHPIESGSVGFRYLQSRWIRLNECPKVLRAHPAMAVYSDGKRTGQNLPAMLGVITNGEGRPCGLHATLLSPDGSGKADIDSPRKIIGLSEGSTRGGCIRLMAPKDGVIGLGEGIESTLSASILTGVPGWPALTAGGIERAILPMDIKKVVIFADRDRAGLSAAANACERFKKEGRESEILAPNVWGQDFNDVLKMENAHSVAS